MSDRRKRHLWRCPKCFLIEVWKYCPGYEVRSKDTGKPIIVTGKYCGECKSPMGYVGYTHDTRFVLEGGEA